MAITTTLYANKTGAYRLTARYKLSAGTNATAGRRVAGKAPTATAPRPSGAVTDANTNPWVYYTTNGRRDHALVVSPTQARDIQLYELNALNIDAAGDQPGQRSTFADLHDSTKRWNLIVPQRTSAATGCGSSRSIPTASTAARPTRTRAPHTRSAARTR